MRVLPVPGRADEKNIRFFELDLIARRSDLAGNTPIMIVDGDRDDLLGLVLPDDILIEKFLNLRRAGKLEIERFGWLLRDGYSLIANLNAILANERRAAGEKARGLRGRTSAKCAFTLVRPGRLFTFRWQLYLSYLAFLS